MTTRCGYVAIIGRPNTGKSTLFNHFIQTKVSSVSYKPQTTRHRIVGVRSEKQAQFVFVDTPGIHLGGKKLLNRILNKNALNVLHDVNLILWMVDCKSWTREEDNILRSLKDIECPVILVLNKIDQLTKRDQLFPILSAISKKYDFAEIVPISALKKDNISALLTSSQRYLPESEFFYPEEYITDRDMRFIMAELIRESVFVHLGAELPYATHVEIESVDEQPGMVHIEAAVWVEKDSQKAIFIGHRGEMLKKIGAGARVAIERSMESKVNLKL
ncbi:MAG: GTPase Era, partial [Proteobacteria bacterium]|nr:GTPase Era [Pseudomonadota bacterium]